MADYALFLKCDFRVTTGNFSKNGEARKPDARFWSEVRTPGGVLTAQGQRTNGDTDTIKVSAPRNPGGAHVVENVYFAVRLLNAPNGITLRNISFCCGLQPSISINRGTTASPFRAANSPTGEVQCLLTGANPGVVIMSGNGGPPGSVSEQYMAIGPFRAFPDQDASIVFPDCCFYKFTLVASVPTTTAPNAPSREYSYDPDMDVEMGL